MKLAISFEINVNEKNEEEIEMKEYNKKREKYFFFFLRIFI